MRILIVEDEMIAALYVERLLVKLDYEPLEIVAEGNKAVEVAESERPDLILMDINLKGEMDGIQAVIKIREFLDVPVIYMTAYSNHEVVERAKVTTPSAYLVKPFDATDLSVAIKMAVHKHEVDKKLARNTLALKKLSRQLQDVQEEERRRIAREVHDVLGQNLIGLKLLLSSLIREVDGTLTEKGKRIKKDFDEAFDELVDNMHRIADGLRPVMLDKVGLVEAVKWEMKQFEKKTGLPCHIECTAQEEEVNKMLDKSIQTAIFRIMQESLTNIVKHSRASEIQLEMTQNDLYFYLRVKDNGVGISDNDLEREGQGILGMKERAEHLGGSFAIHSKKDKGSVVEVSFPLMKA